MAEIEIKKEHEGNISWRVDEYHKHERTIVWYGAAIIVAMLLLAFSFFTSNFLFMVIIIIASLVIILHDGQEPARIKVTLNEEGVVVGRKFYDFDEIKHFSIIYKPSQGIRGLYFEFKSVLQPRLSISLENMNPLPIRKFLLKYLPEDLERTDEPLSESLARLFKL